MRVYIEGFELDVDMVREELFEAVGGQIDLDVAGSGRRSNMAGDPASFVTLVVNSVAGVALNMLASYLYDLVRNRKKIVKVDGKSLENVTIGEIEKRIRESVDPR